MRAHGRSALEKLIDPLLRALHHELWIDVSISRVLDEGAFQDFTQRFRPWRHRSRLGRPIQSHNRF